MRKWSIISGVVGIVLVVAALIVAYAVAPAVVKLPSDTNVTRTFAGTASTLLNPSAVATGNASQAILHNVPIITEKHNYLGWLSDTGQSTTLRYAGTANRGGEHVDVFTTTSTPQPLTDPNQLRTLPTALPKSLIPTLAAANGIPASALQAAA